MLLVIPCIFLNKQTEGIIFRNHYPTQVANDKSKIVMWNPVLNLKPKAEKFEEITTVKLIIESIIKALLKNIILITSNQFTVMIWCLGSPV